MQVPSGFREFSFCRQACRSRHMLSDSFIEHMIGINVTEANDGFSLRDGCIVAKCSPILESS